MPGSFPRRAVAVLALSLVAGCHRGVETRPSRPVSRDGAGFVGMIYEVRAMTLRAEEQSLDKRRLAEIWVSPSTEITDRGGSLLPFETLRRGMRLTVWFTSDFTETATAVQGRARRIVVEY